MVHTIFYLVVGTALHILIIPLSSVQKRKIISIMTQSWAMGICWMFNIHVNVFGKENIEQNEAYLVVANHLSYMDVCLIGSVIPTQFVGKSEVTRWPVFGWMGKIGGVIFIDRTKITSGVSRSKLIAKNLIEGNSVTFFPEGTTTIGDSLLTFKPSIYLASIESNKPVLPITITYDKINGEPFNHDLKKIYAWCDNKLTFLGHGLRMLKCKKMSMNLTIHAPIKVSNGMDARDLLRLSQESIESAMLV